MPTVRRYPDALSAQVAAGRLRQRGITCAVLGGIDAFGGLSPTPMRAAGLFSVVLRDAARLDEALAILDEDDLGPDTDWEEHTRPDLSRLDPALEAPCPHCGAPLPHDAAITACPACGGAADPVEVLVEQHGPEVLADCYPDEDEIPDEALAGAAIGCPFCGYELAGLPAAGLCPECGERYSKRAILRWAGPL